MYKGQFIRGGELSKATAVTKDSHRSNDSPTSRQYGFIEMVLLTYMFEEPATISRALRLMFVARNLERIGDHAANIAEMVIFLVEGHDIRHSQTAKM